MSNAELVARLERQFAGQLVKSAEVRIRHRQQEKKAVGCGSLVDLRQGAAPSQSEPEPVAKAQGLAPLAPLSRLRAEELLLLGQEL